MPMRFFASLVPALTLLSACASVPTDRPAAVGEGTYLVIVTDKAGVRPLSEQERNDPQMRVKIDACERAGNRYCRSAPDFGQARSIFTRGVDDAVVVAFWGPLQPGKHLFTCKWLGPAGETVAVQNRIDVDPAEMAFRTNAHWCRAELGRNGLSTRGLWQVELLIDGEMLARPTFTIRERGELKV